MTAVIDNIKQLEEQRRVAMLHGDVMTLTRLLADELVYVHSNGDLDSRATYLTKLDAGLFDYRKIEFYDQHVAMVDDTAVVAGRMTADVVVAGRTRHIEARMTSVWHKRDANWQMLSFQNTPIVQL
jgi:ketosteroid isomerase-like protein